MRRRHLFDLGYPVAVRTYLAGAAVLLAVARHAHRLSHARLRRSILAIARSQQRLLYTRSLIHGNHAQPDQRVEAGVEVEPGAGAPRQAAHPA